MAEKRGLGPLAITMLLLVTVVVALPGCGPISPAEVVQVAAETEGTPTACSSTPPPTRTPVPSSTPVIPTPVIPTWTPVPALTGTTPSLPSTFPPEDGEALVSEPAALLHKRQLGLSTGRLPIEAYQVGTGDVRIAFVGGIHGGYEWNTILLAYQAIDFFAAHPDEVPEAISLIIVPVANPDGQYAVIGHDGRFSPAEVAADSLPGRFNANGVDLNRNWACGWVPVAFLGEQEISAGSAPFSEVETRILRFFLTSPNMDAVVFWHSAKPGVFAGECGEPLPGAVALAAVYAEATGYPLFDGFDDYPVTGDASDWLSGIGIPAITVELRDHGGIDWPQNLAGMRAVLNAFDSGRATEGAR